MARAPLLQLSGISLTFGGNPLLDGLDLVVNEGDRLALIGRNGSGKSTLMKVMAGLVASDAGSAVAGPGVTVAYMEQDPDLSAYPALGDFACAGLPGGREGADAWRAERVADGIGLDLSLPSATASGGERRRAALVRLMAGEPDLMLLDEPTNHLDIAAIEWLEAELSASRAGMVIISHDRAFLRGLARGMLWLDRGVLRRLNRPFDAFEDWRDTVWEEEDTQRHKLDRKIKAEARWAVEGISARRKRNMGRVRALQALRADRAAQIRRQGTAALALEAGTQSGRKVIEATGITKSFGGRTVLRPLSLRVLRGDRIAFVGPNGAGKTTLLRLLTGNLAPDAGTVSMGTGLEIAVFDQARAALDPQMTLWDSLTQDPALKGGSSDQVMVRGVARHVVGYLKDFLFDEAQARAPVRALSGGERARLLLARIMARPSNLLVLDEPTNDLDVETLDLLQDVLGEYDGTVLIVSHDRDFLDRVATQTVWLGGDGRATVYAGGWTDMRAQGGGPGGAVAEVSARPSPVSVAATASKATPGRSLSFTERHRLDALPAEIDRLTAEIGKLEGLLADADLFAREPVKFRKATEALAERQAKLDAAEEEWLALAERAEG
jgi:ATP-binding cassette subfamily F protein uup